jgi:hypothetical protein
MCLGSVMCPESVTFLWFILLLAKRPYIICFSWNDSLNPSSPGDSLVLHVLYN